MSLLRRFRIPCTTCPWDKGDIYERDCSAPDCCPYIWQVWWWNFRFWLSDVVGL